MVNKEGFPTEKGIKKTLREESTQLGRPFLEYSGNPLVEGSGKPNDWREFGASAPLVVLNPEDGKYYMFCRGFKNARLRQDDCIVQIGLFISEDGLNWREYSDNPVIPVGGSGEWDEKACHTTGGSVFWDEDADCWRLYYWGEDADGVGKVGMAESDDLKIWTKRSENPLISTRSTDGGPSVRCGGVLNRNTAPQRVSVVLDDGRRGELGAGQVLEIYGCNDGVSWTHEKEYVFAPQASDVQKSNVYPQAPEIFTPQKLFGLFVIPYEAWGMYQGQYYIGALASYDALHWWQVPKPIYQETGYGARSPFWFTLHPYILLSRDGAFLYHTNAYRHRDVNGNFGGYVERTEVALIDPSWLRDVLTSKGVNYIWDDESVSAGTYGYSWVNALGFSRKTLYFESDTSGDLTIEADPDGTGNWITLKTYSSITTAKFQTTYDFTHLRVKFSADATLTARLVMRK